MDPGRNSALKISKFSDIRTQCCGSGMFVPHPDFYPSRISNPRSNNSKEAVLRIRDVFIPDLGFCPSRIQKQQQKSEREGWKRFVVIPFFETTNITQLKLILFLSRWRKNGPIYCQRIIELFYPNKMSLSSQKYGVGIRCLWLRDPD